MTRSSRQKKKDELNKSVIKTMAVLALLVLVWSLSLSLLKYYSHARYCNWFSFSHSVQNEPMCYAQTNKDRSEISVPKPSQQ